MNLHRHGLVLAAAMAFSNPALASVTVDVDGDTVTADIEIGTLEADMTITFENAIGLTAESIGISATTISVTDVSLLARLPSGMSIPAAFPLKITVEPPSAKGLSFTGAATIEIHTHALSLVTNSPLRLMKAPLGGDFVDITESLASGSVRSRGRTGGFSEFIIGIDTRSHATMASAKFDDLDDVLADATLPSALRTTLEDYVDDARADYLLGDYVDAIDDLEDFIDEVEDEAGGDIANVWRASRDLDNDAGLMIAQAKTLIFSLRMLNALP